MLIAQFASAIYWTNSRRWSSPTSRNFGM